MNKKKIAVIGAKGLPGYGGAARTNDNILRRLSYKYDITVYAIDSHAQLKSYYGLRQYIFKSYNNKSLTSLTYYLKSVLHSIFIENYDLIHLNHRVSGILIPILKLKGYKIISSLHGLGYDNDDKWSWLTKKIFRFFQVLSFKLPDIVTTVQRSSVDIIKSQSNKPIYFIPNGVEVNLKLVGRKSIKDIITFSAARIINLKGCHVFLQALKELEYKGKVRIIGDINHVESYKKEILNLSSNLDVEFLGLIKNSKLLFESLSESKLFVFPSYTEGMSNMLLEVSSLQVPIIASDIQPNRDVFDETEVTFFKVGDSSDLASKIKFALNNHAIVEIKAQKALNRVKREYDWDHIAEYYTKVYDELLI